MGNRRQDSLKFVALCLLLTVMLSAWPGGAFPASQTPGKPADDKGITDAAPAQASPKPKSAGENSTLKSNLRMDEVEIHGDVEKPNTMFVIPRASLQFDRKEYDKDFTGEILDPVTKQWFEDSQRWRDAIPPP